MRTVLPTLQLRHTKWPGAVAPAPGIAVHDGWAPYDTYDQATHARCNAHFLRELQAVLDHHDRSGRTGQWCWAPRPPTPYAP